MEMARKRENKNQQHCEWCMLIIKHLRDGVFLIPDISKDPNSADKTVTIDLTMQTQPFSFTILVMTSHRHKGFFLQRWRYLLNPDPKPNPVTNLLISVNWWFDRIMSLSNREKHFRWPLKLVFSKPHYTCGDILKYLALTNIFKLVYTQLSISKQNRTITSNSLSLWILGVKWSLSTSHANGGCQS